MDDKPIIVIKKKAHAHGHHGGAWKVAYADFVTAMMAFFLVMWILGLSQETRKSIAAYFNDPVGALKKPGGQNNPFGTPAGGKPSPMPEMQNFAKKREKENEQFIKTKEELEKMIRKMPEFQDIKQFIDIQISDDGLRIDMMEGEKSLFFESGSAVMQPKMIKLLHLIGDRVKYLHNHVALEGHTDATPYGGNNPNYSNWELSTDRANAARRELNSTLPKDQISAVHGYADQRLRNKKDPFDFSNRRISVLVKFTTPNEAKGEEVHEEDGALVTKPLKPTIHHGGG